MDNSSIPLLDNLKRWIQRLSYQFNLASKGASPQIVSFQNHSLFIASYGKIHLSWEVKNAHRVMISGIGEVTGRREIVAKMPPNTTEFLLTAYGGLRKKSQRIEVNVAPLHAEKMPMAGMEIPKPAIKSLAMKQKEGIFNQASGKSSEGMAVQWPIHPAPADWERLRNSLKNTLEVKKLDQLEAHLAQLQQQDILGND